MSDEMSMQLKTIIGHHGTSNDLKNRIIQTNFTTSYSGWFGKGVYFYEDDYDMALEWAMIRYPNKIPKVIECLIEVEDTALLDLTDIKGDDYYIFKEVYENELLKFLEDAKLSFKNNYEYDSYIIEFIKRAMNIKVFKITSNTPSLNMRDLGFFSRINNGIEVIVSDTNLIKNKS